MKRLLCIIKKSILTVIAVMAALRHTIHRKLHRVVMANVMTGVLVLSLIFTGITVYVYSYDDGEAPAETSVNVADDNAYGILESIAKSDPEKTDVIIAEPEYKDVLTDGNVELEKDVPATEAEIEANSDTATGTEENAGDIAVLGETTPDDDGTKEKNSTIDENILKKYNDPGEQDMTVNAYGYTGTYDGQAHGITINVTKPAAGAVITYKISGDNTYGSEVPTFTDAGEHRVDYRITADGYATYEGNVSISIAKRKAVVKPAAKEKEYGSTDTTSYSYEAEGILAADSLSGELGREAGEDAGTYKFTLGTLNNDNYNISLSPNSSVYSIVPKSLSKVTVTADKFSFVYDGTPHKPLIVITDDEKVLKEGTDYTLSGSLSESGVGDYSIFIDGCGNYDGFTTMEYSITEPVVNNKLISVSDPSSDNSVTTEQKKTEQKTTKTSKKSKAVKNTNKKKNKTVASADKKNGGSKSEDKNDSGALSSNDSEVHTGDKVSLRLLWSIMLVAIMMLIAGILYRRKYDKR